MIDGSAGSEGVLFVVATPIGNLGDITLRAIDVLKGVDYYAGENFESLLRIASRFFPDKKISKRNFFKMNQATERKIAPKIVSVLQKGHDVALLTDAGTPSISDPGWMVADLAQKRGIRVVPIPGPSAFVAAFSASGFEPAPFVFIGFLPRKGRASFLKKYAPPHFRGHFIVYVSPHRLREELRFLRDFFGGEREAFLVKELTKVYERYWRAPLEELVKKVYSFDEHESKGEWVLVIRGNK